jgi:hypothetical protein
LPGAQPCTALAPFRNFVSTVGDGSAVVLGRIELRPRHAPPQEFGRCDVHGLTHAPTN